MPCLYIYIYCICIVINNKERKEKSICSAKADAFVSRSAGATFHCSSMAECSLEDDDWETVQRYTVVLSGPKDGFPYSREDFRAPLTAVIGGEVSAHALSFGPCGMNSEWWLTLKDQESRDRLLLAGAIKVRNRYVFRIRSASKSQFVVRVHWAPPFMSNKFIGQMLSKHVKIVSMDKETAVADGFDGMATGIRKIVVEGNMGDVPHKSSVVCPFTGVTHNILLVINGRKSLCLRCNGEGHGRRDCKAQYCRLHKTFGHSYESCVERKLQFAREARHEGMELTAEEERLLEEDTLRHSLTAGQGESVARAGSDTSPAPQTQVIAGACIVFGHSSESCASKPTRGGRAKSYASAAGGSGPVERDRQTGEVGASAPSASAPAPAAATCTADVGVVVAAECDAPPFDDAGRDGGGRCF